MRLLQAQRWPGNVRQLVNFVERLVVLSTGRTVTTDNVRFQLDEHMAFVTQAAPLDSRSLDPRSARPLEGADRRAEKPGVVEAPGQKPELLSSSVRPLREDLKRAEHRALTKALKSAKGNRALAARLLGVSRRTLYTKLEEHGIE